MPSTGRLKSAKGCVPKRARVYIGSTPQTVTVTTRLIPWFGITKVELPSLEVGWGFYGFHNLGLERGPKPHIFHGLLGATLVCFLYTNLTSKQLQELWLWHVPHVEAQASTNEFHKFVPPIGAVEKTHRAPRNQLIFMEVFPSLFCKVNFQDIWMNEESWGFGL